MYVLVWMVLIMLLTICYSCIRSLLRLAPNYVVGTMEAVSLRVRRPYLGGRFVHLSTIMYMYVASWDQRQCPD